VSVKEVGGNLVGWDGRLNIGSKSLSSRQDAAMSTTSSRARRPSAESLTPEQRATAEALHKDMMEAVGGDLAALSQLLSTKTDATIFGDTEFQVRDLVHAIGAKAIQAAIAAQKKRATTAAPASAPVAESRPNSSDGSSSPS
jgi:hypothetical protein